MCGARQGKAQRIRLVKNSSTYDWSLTLEKSNKQLVKNISRLCLRVHIFLYLCIHIYIYMYVYLYIRVVITIQDVKKHFRLKQAFFKHTYSCIIQCAILNRLLHRYKFVSTIFMIF